MNCYLVFMPEGTEKLEQAFPNTHYEISADFWAIGSDLPTCVDVCQHLGIEDEQRMVVVSMSDYYGRFDRALWQRLDSWSKT